MDEWYLNNIVCPRDHSPLRYMNDELVCMSEGHRYPVVDGVPVMLLEDIEQTMPLVHASIKRAKRISRDERAPHLYLESLGISEDEKKGLIRLALNNKVDVDPVVSYICAATCGRLYKHLIGKLKSYPIPHLRLPPGNGRLFLDIGCNWGRWSIAAKRKGYNVIGIDPSLGAIMTAKRASEQLGLSIKYLVADGRRMPFSNSSFNIVFSYAVLQHLSRIDTKTVVSEASRVLKPQGKSLIHMPNFLGFVSLYHQAKRRFREGTRFEVRYWSIPALKKLFSNKIGKTKIVADSYFGLQVQLSDVRFMTLRKKIVVIFSGIIRWLSRLIPVLTFFADGVYVKSMANKEIKDIHST
ncbi:MAG: methyltransferase domain-containing protein [Candidatus Omnitrophica bacterium]|nr:methyltransferase domain-containing protein [Candidatus Omnitrophota bacterium]